MFRQLKVKGLASGDGFSACKLLKEIYETGSTQRLMQNFTKFVNLTEAKAGSLTAFTYEFNELFQYLKQQKSEVPDALAMCMYLKGLSPKHARVVDRMKDESRNKIQTLEEAMERIAHNAENSPTEMGAVGAGGQNSNPGKENSDKNNDREGFDATKSHNCFNCGKKHIGGKRKCS